MTTLRWLALAFVLAVAGCAGKGPRPDAREAARVNAQLGISYAQRGQYAAALDKLTRALKYDDTLSAAHSGIALVYQNLGEPVKAVKHYRRALDLDPDDPALKNNFAVLLCSQGRSSEAERYFTEAARDPRYATPEAALTNAGLCLRTADPVKAERYLREALQLKPDYREALAQMAGISFRQGDYLRTRAFLQRYNLDTAATAELLYIAARTEAELGDAAAARRLTQRLRAEFPESEEAAYDFPSP